MLQSAKSQGRVSKAGENWRYGASVARNEIQPSIRTEKLREQYLKIRGSVGWQVAYWVTKVYKETEGYPFAIRKARSLKEYFENCDVCIQPWELVVGVLDQKPKRHPVWFNITTWALDELDIFPTRWPDPFDIDEETKEKLRECGPYWKDKCVKDIWLHTITQVAPWILEIAFKTGILDLGGCTNLGIGHFAMGYNHLIAKGATGFRKDIEEQQKKLGIDDPFYVEKATFYEALLLICEVLEIMGRRYANHARELAAKEKNLERKADYLKIAEVCNQVPANPARNFHEALQTIYFGQILGHLSSCTYGISPGRLDQYLYHYFKRDIEEKKITKEEAQELIECLWIKISEIPELLSSQQAKYAAGWPNGQQVCLGGVNEWGRDASNELTFMMLQASANTRIERPPTSVVWHPDMPEDLVKKICRVISLGTGHPMNYNVPVLVQILQELGLPLEDARRGCYYGCVEPTGPEGTTATWDCAGHFNIPAAVELLLTNGVWRKSGKQIGIQTGDPRTFKTFEDVIEAYSKQIDFLMGVHTLSANFAMQIHKGMEPDLFASLLTPHCIETGLDINAGGAKYNLGPSPWVMGIADTVDSLAAIKYLIYDSKKLRWEQLLHALDSNYEDVKTIPTGPEIRQMCLSAPKYGNNIAWVDEIAQKAMYVLPVAAAKHIHPITGKKWRISNLPLTAGIPFGQAIGALPSGRLAGEPFAEGCSPKHGMDANGPTAAILSVTSWDHASFLNGVQYNMKLSPMALVSESGLNKLAALIKTYMSRGGGHIQFNVVSADLLRDAQKHPENYPGLLVRVAGYSAFFTDLDPVVQNDIISRTEHVL